MRSLKFFGLGAALVLLTLAAANSSAITWEAGLQPPPPPVKPPDYSAFFKLQLPITAVMVADFDVLRERVTRGWHTIVGIMVTAEASYTYQAVVFLITEDVVYYQASYRGELRIYGQYVSDFLNHPQYKWDRQIYSVTPVYPSQIPWAIDTHAVEHLDSFSIAFPYNPQQSKVEIVQEKIAVNPQRGPQDTIRITYEINKDDQAFQGAPRFAVDFKDYSQVDLAKFLLGGVSLANHTFLTIKLKVDARTTLEITGEIRNAQGAVIGGVQPFVANIIRTGRWVDVRVPLRMETLVAQGSILGKVLITAYEKVGTPDLQGTIQIAEMYLE